ncbi:hypothetical protein [Streptomyces spirodelae]|uniref:Uncharacterized protein n=1 Tax=Streptomyces spirodelae TaxID=2812904 RepID=A0ABS3WSZ4_9ACTN|nr:hypothetical protein [Streptomyces spirodelae]MBO8186250.1 hypothetical protein [Streptomyces spirodelae]
MKFVLEVDTTEMRGEGEAATELGRVLRYWGGNLRHYGLQPGDGSPVYDSKYREIGNWRITESS